MTEPPLPAPQLDAEGTREELASPRLEAHNPVFASAPAAFAEAEREHQAARPTAEERKKLRPLSV